MRREKGITLELYKIAVTLDGGLDTKSDYSALWKVSGLREGFLKTVDASVYLEGRYQKRKVEIHQYT